MAILGKLQRFKLQIVIPGETHSSKSQLGMQLANAFAALGDDVAWVDWEQGGLESKDTQDMISRNTDPENKKRIHVNGNLLRTLVVICFQIVFFDRLHTDAAPVMIPGKRL